MYRIAMVVDGENVIVFIDESTDVGKFVFWTVANYYVINSIEKVKEVQENSTVAQWLIESYKKEEKFKGE